MPAPSAGTETEAVEIAGRIRSAAEYRLYTRTQPLTVPQLAADLGVRPASAAVALELLHREQFLEQVRDRGADGGLYRVRVQQDLPTLTVDWAVEQVRMQLATGLHPAGSVFRIDLAEVLFNVGTLPDLPRQLQSQGLLRRAGGQWVVTRNARKLPRPPRVSEPAPHHRVVFTRDEILVTVTMLRHDGRRIPLPARADVDSWHRLRAMAAHVQAALPPVATSGEQAFVNAALSVGSWVLAPLEPTARRWHVAWLATAIDAALATLPADPAPPPAELPLTPRNRDKHLTGWEREEAGAEAAYAYDVKQLRVAEIAQATGLSVSVVYGLLREKRVELRGRG
ncbi:hypothetical protein ACFY7Y_33700 [Streptomyces virginiae]|uniref:hypothetical protein n=1 Tax=Streptomyces TaxID=1883 RepID=UPI002E2CD164|nr:hypothetical protein [Streptomyces sp. NBC_00239]WSX96975.1 hypothetical protein OG590_06785 [Streptomyces goshikiensis]